MNPNGLVAAALMTSQTSRPIRSHSSASWLTNAMLTLRKTFSSSLASSAASGDDSVTTWSLMLRSSAAARSVAAGVVAPTRRGTPLLALAGIARVDPLGGEGEVEVGAGRRGRSRSRTSRNGPVVVPGKVVDWRMTSWPGRRCSRIVSAADRTGARSGSLVVGDRRRDAHEDGVGLADRASAGRDDGRPLARAAARRSSETSSIGDEPALARRPAAAKASMPSTCRPASTNEIASGRPT